MQRFRILGYPPTTITRPFDIIHAKLGNGSLGESSLVIDYDSVVDKSLPRSVHPTVPYPIRAGSDALFGVAFANGGASTTVTRVDVQIPGGYDLQAPEDAAGPFTGVTPLADTSRDGNWSLVDGTGGTHLRWTGNRTLLAGAATQWIFGVQTHPDAATSVEGRRASSPVSQLVFPNGFVHTSTEPGPSPGMIRHRVPPDDRDTAAADGYPWTLPVEGADPVVSYNATFRNTRGAVHGTGSYRVLPEGASMVDLEGAIGNSTMAVPARVAPIGSGLKVDVDLESVANELASHGVSNLTMNVSLFAPPSIGCKATHSWVREAATLPLAAVRHAEVVQDATGTPSVLVLANDGQLYRLDAMARPFWSHDLLAEGTTFASARHGLLGHSVFLGDASGNLTGVDLATGEARWRVAVAPSPEASPARGGVTVVAPSDPERAQVLVGTDAHALEVRSAETGTLEARRATAAKNGTYLQAAWLPQERVLALHQKGIELLDANLGEVASHDFADAVSFAVTPSGILLSAGNETRVLDPATLELRATLDHSRRVVLATSRGDATGDGTTDHVVALEGLRIVVIDGTTGTVAAESYAPHLTLLHEGAEIEVPPFGAPSSIDDFDVIGMGTPEHPRVGPCRNGASVSDVPSRYDPVRLCLRPSHGDKSVHAHALEVAEGRVTLAYSVGGVPLVEQWRHDGGGTSDWTRQLDYGQTPTVLASGDWTLGGRSLVVGTSTGALHVVDPDAAGSTRWSASPGDFVGRFTFTMHVPQGGFFGTHLLVATLSWTDSQGENQSASLSDWFHVVKPDGTPSIKHVYRVSGVIEARDDPHRTKR